MDYKTLYFAEKEKNCLLEKKLFLLQKELKSLRLSIINSNTAKNGFKEEDFICDYLNKNNDLLIKTGKFKNFRVNDENFCYRKKDVSKIDILTTNEKFTAQVKKYVTGRFQQLGRMWIDDIIVHISQIKSISNMLKNLCEYPLDENNMIIKSHQRKCLSSQYYSKDELKTFIDVLNKNKKNLLKSAFYGLDYFKTKKCFQNISYV